MSAFELQTVANKVDFGYKGLGWRGQNVQPGTSFGAVLHLSGFERTLYEVEVSGGDMKVRIGL